MILIHILILMHVYVWKSSVIGSIDFQEFFHSFLKLGIINAGTLLVLIAFTFTLIFGRFFCGWACHFGAIQEFSYYILKKLKVETFTIDSKLVTILPLIVLLNYYVIPNAYHAFQNPWSSITVTLNEPKIWAFLPGFFIGSLTFLIDGFLIVYFLGKKGFCRFICPWGAFLKIPNSLALFKVRKTGECTQCHVCTTECPVGIDVSYEINTFNKVVSANCTSCLKCTSGCPSSALSYKFSNPLKENYTLNHFLPKIDNFKHPNINRLFKSFRKSDYKILFSTILLSISIDGLYGIGHFLAYGIGIIASFFIFVFSKRLTYFLRTSSIVLIIVLFSWHGLIKYSIWNGIRYYDSQEYLKSIPHLERVNRLSPKDIGRFNLLLGMMYLENNNLPKALFYANKALLINPQHKAPKELIELINNKSN
ncbi:4Fe-4S binding protein [Candidatus Marinimicrobia bacterium]|nr:4Fe-4S binding protein [Candidatus Neomarinimicrobiota bacterium]